MLILVDVDSTVARMLPEWLKRYNRDYDDNLTEEMITSWDMTKFIKPQCGSDIYKYLSDPTLYDEVEPYYGALAVINEIRRRGHRAVFLSAGVSGAYTKLKWLKRHGFLNAGDFTDRDFICAYDKSLIMGDFLIDDRDKNVIDFGRGILMDRPWNLATQIAPNIDIKRADSWPKVQSIITLRELGYR